MKNITNEIKAKYFSLYYYRQVLGKYINSDELDPIDIMNPCEVEYIELTPLENISDEDAIEVAKIVMKRHDRHYSKVDYNVISKSEKYIKISVKAKEELRTLMVTIGLNEIGLTELSIGEKKETFESNDYFTPNTFIAFQYLLSKGYALPYMDYSVSDLIENGTIRFKTK